LHKDIYGRSIKLATLENYPMTLIFEWRVAIRIIRALHSLARLATPIVLV